MSVAYYPDGSGPVIEGRGPLHLVYQDASRSLAFYGEEVRTVEVPDLGNLVSVTIVETEDTGYTSFSLPVPDVDLPADKSSRWSTFRSVKSSSGRSSRRAPVASSSLQGLTSPTSAPELGPVASVLAG